MCATNRHRFTVLHHPREAKVTQLHFAALLYEYVLAFEVWGREDEMEREDEERRRERERERERER